MQIRYMKPFFTKPMGNILKLVFAYQYLTILKDDELYMFVPVEGKEILVNLETNQIENLSEVFVFQRGNRFIRMPLYQLLLVCEGFGENIRAIVERQTENEVRIDEQEPTEKELLIQTLEEMNIRREIDKALDKRDFETARKLADLCK